MHHEREFAWRKLANGTDFKDEVMAPKIKSDQKKAIADFDEWLKQHKW